jgi:hypothetical protein
MTQFIPPTLFHLVTGTWTDLAGAVAGTIAAHKAAADQVAVVTIPILIPSNAANEKGSRLKSIEIDFEYLIEAMDAMAAVVNKITRGAEGAVAVVAAQAFSYDTGHDTAAERIDVDQHKMTLTLTTPIWIDNDVEVLVELTIDAGTNGTIELYGAFANFDLRAS